jgi:hypothetical protein
MLMGFVEDLEAHRREGVGELRSDRILNAHSRARRRFRNQFAEHVKRILSSLRVFSKAPHNRQ